MANVKSDKVKQSIDNLEKYHLFTEGKLKLFIVKEFDQCGSLPCKIILDGEMYHLLVQLPLTADDKKQPRSVFWKYFCQCGTELHRMLTDAWYLFDWFHSWLLHFSWMEHTSKTIKARKPFAFISLSWNRYEKDSINKMNNGQANH